MYKTKRYVSIFIVMIMMLTMIPVPAFAAVNANQTFADMPSDWSTKPLEAAVKNGLLTGFNENGKALIKGNSQLTRAQLAAVINKAFNATEMASITGVTDVKASDWYAEHMAKAIQMDSFARAERMRPDDNITREEAFTVLAKVFKLSEGNAASLSRFSDASSVSDYAKGRIAALLDAGYISGSGGKLNPKANITRAEFAAVMGNIVSQYVNETGEVTSIETGNVLVNTAGVTLKNLTVNGDLILADGIGSGDITIDSVKVTGRLVVRGGGANSVKIIGTSDIKEIIVDSKNNEVRIYTTDGVKVAKLDASNKVILEGSFGSISVSGDDSELKVKGTIETLTVNATSVVYIEESAKVGTIEVAKTAVGTSIEVAGTVTTITTAAPNTALEVSGAVTNIKIEASATDPKVAVEAGANVKTLDSQVPVTPTGSGKIETVNAPKAEQPATAPAGSGSSGGGKKDTTPDYGPIPTEFTATRSGGYAKTDYSVRYDVSASQGVTGNLVFYSEYGESIIKTSVAGLTAAEIDQMVTDGKAIRGGVTADAPLALTADLKDFNGNAYTADKMYYIYGLTIKATGAGALSKAEKILTPERYTVNPILDNIGDGPGQGAVMPAGGATSLNPASNTGQAYIKAFKQATSASGITPRVAVLEIAYDGGKETTMYDAFYLGDAEYAPDADLLRQSGCEPVYIPLGTDNFRSVANEQYFADLIRSCHVVLMVGGDQTLPARGLLNDDGTLSLVGQAIVDVYEHGGTICGTSAGAQVMSNPAFQEGASNSYQPMFWNGAETADIGSYEPKTDPLISSKKSGNNIYYAATGFIDVATGKKVLVDSHFDARGRLGRLVVALRDTNPTGLAMGLDEGTGIRVVDKVGTVFGPGGVFIVDAANAVWEPAGTDNDFGVTGLRLHYLTEGDTYNFDTKAVASVGTLHNGEGSVSITNGAFNAYQMSRIINQFVNSSGSSISVPVAKNYSATFATGPIFTVSLEKDGTTKCYQSSKTYSETDCTAGSAATTLNSLNRVTASDMKMSITAHADALTIVNVTKSGDSAANIAFNNSIKAFDLSSNEKSYYVVASRGGVELAQAAASLAIGGEKNRTVSVALDGQTFQAGDQIVVKDTLCDTSDQVIAGGVTYTFNGAVWAKGNVPAPLLAVTSVTKASRTYDALVTFNNSMKVGYEGQSNYLIDTEKANPDIPSDYIEALRDGVRLNQYDYSTQIFTDSKDSNKVVRVILDTDDFERGDQLVIKTLPEDVYGQHLAEPVTYTFTGEEWVLGTDLPEPPEPPVVDPLEVQAVEYNASNSIKVTFNNNLKVRYEGSRIYLINSDEDTPSDYIEVIRGGIRVEQDDEYTMNFLDGKTYSKVVRILLSDDELLAAGDFIAGDQIVIKTIIEDVFGQSLPADLTYEYDGTSWTLVL